MVCHLHGHGTVLQTRGKYAAFMAQNRHHPGFIVGGDGGHPVAQARRYFAGVFHKQMDRIAVGPTARRLQFQGEVPMVQGDIGLNAARQHAVHQAFVKIKPFLVPGPGATGTHAGPGDGKAVSIHAQSGNQIEVLLPAAVVRTGYIAIAGIGNGAGHATKLVPDRETLAILLRCTFNLKRAGGYTPHKMGRKALVQSR